ncbi:hypothetical protein LPJ61_000932 [Coemansia biformis]|uniref:WD40 repeat-like protein n=1 Tax=Coemansia biformis TaxID=1286918 RepID=A0A9W7YIP2_9FUNG|nr:hypothetical protein LPJ61_000932 [Coemansia biformis]
MCAGRTAFTFEERGIRPPPRDAVTVGEADLKFIQLRGGDDVGLLQYVRSGGIAFPHIMIPETLQLRGAGQASGLGDGGPLSSASIVNRRRDEQQRQDDADAQHGPSAAADSAFSMAFSHALWLWNAKTHMADLASGLQTRLLLSAESWLPAPLAQLVFGQIPGTASAAKADALETEEVEGQKNMLAKTDGPIGCIAWHPHRSLVAIAHRTSDCVFLYDLASDAWCTSVLQSASMKGIASMAWQPNCGYALAVGCTVGVCLWSLVPGSGARDPADAARAPSLGEARFSSWMTVLAYPPPKEARTHRKQPAEESWAAAHRSAASVSTVSFSHCGQWLVAGHQTHGHLSIWDVALGSATPLKRSGSSSRAATLQVSFSPDDRYLASMHANGQLRLWETEGWTSRVWSEFGAPVTQFSWSPDSRSAFFAVASSPDIFALALYRAPPSLDAEVTVASSFVAHAAAVTDGSVDPEQIRVGGAIKLLALDPKGQRLVVGFDDDDSSSADISLLAVYLVSTDALFRAGGDSSALMPLGYVRGPNWGKQRQLEKSTSAEPALRSDRSAKKKRVRVGSPTPSWIGFSPSFEPGALLTVAWANGKISLVPMIFQCGK